MANNSINLCPPPFYDQTLFPDHGGFVDGRVCQAISKDLSCCLPCPMTDWVYPDSFDTVTWAVDWVATASMVFCVFLLISWACLPIDKTSRHYLSICLTIGVALMNLGFIIPLAAKPDECYNEITPNDMQSSTICGASGTFLLLGGWAGVMWSFLRSLSLHLQICWQMQVGRSFMIFAQGAGWGVPIIGIILALVFSGVSFRFGATCHINHDNSLAVLWIPLLIFAGTTVVMTFATFGYCIKVYLAALSDNTTTALSSLPTYANSMRTMTPRQAYLRVRRVIGLQWRGIAIVLIVIADVIFFSVVFVFQDNVVQSVTHDPKVGEDWTLCLIGAGGDKSQCMDEASDLAVNMATTMAVLLLLSLNGLWALLFLGRWSMVTSWLDLFKKPFQPRKQEFVSIDAHADIKKDSRAYELLSKDVSIEVTRLSPVVSPNSRVASPNDPAASGRRTPDYFVPSATYHAPTRSYSTPRAPQPSWDPSQTYAPPSRQNSANQGHHRQTSNGLSGYNSTKIYHHGHPSIAWSAGEADQEDGINPLAMNKI